MPWRPRCCNPGCYSRVNDYVRATRPREPVESLVRAGPDGRSGERLRPVRRGSEELLFDQMRAVVLSDDRGAGGGLVLNEEFLRFAAHWGFMPRSCRPYRAQTKGKVERPMGVSEDLCSGRFVRH